MAGDMCGRSPPWPTLGWDVMDAIVETPRCLQFRMRTITESSSSAHDLPKKGEALEHNFRSSRQGLGPTAILRESAEFVNLPRFGNGY